MDPYRATLWVIAITVITTGLAFGHTDESRDIDSKTNAFVGSLNFFEDVWNSIMTITQFLVIVWDYAIGWAYVIFQTACDICVIMLVFVKNKLVSIINSPLLSI